MKIALVTDAWLPQVNGVVTTLLELVRDLESREHQVLVIHPGQFKTKPCPGYSGIDLAQRPRELLSRQLDEFVPDAIHVATEGPLGWAARGYCRRNRLQFTTAFHTKFPEILKSAMHVPLWVGGNSRPNPVRAMRALTWRSGRVSCSAGNLMILCLMPSMWPPRAHWAGRRVATAGETDCNSPPPFTPSSLKFCSRPCAFPCG